MFVCPTCNARYDDDANACPVDGSRLVLAPTTEPARRNATPREAPTNAGRSLAARMASPAFAGAAAAAAAVDIAPTVEIEVGDVIGEYHVTGKIGEGGMGSVYAGIHPVIGKKVAIKVLNAALSHDREIVDRFAQEARAVNQIAHRNIVDIFAFGQLPTGRHYCVMEFLEGRNLRARLSRTPPLTHPEVFTLLGDVLDALAAAHAEGIVHRDLKPDNIYLVEDKSGAFRTKLLDFGVAKLLRRPSELGRTRTGAPLGTPFYMSPEQCRNRAVDVRTDIYAMGVIMFEVFTGRLPFAGSDYIDTVNGHLSREPPRPSEIVAIAPRLESLILRCLEKDAELRPQSATELAGELAAIAGDAAGEAVPVPPPLHPDSAVMSTTPPESSPTKSSRPPPARRKRSTQALVAIGVGLAAGTAAFVGARLSNRAPAPSAPAALRLELASDPSGADVVIDGQPQAGKTPLSLSRPWTAVIEVHVEKQGFDSVDATLHPAAGAAELARSFVLAPSAGDLFVMTTVADAHWTLDGLPRAVGPSLRVEHLRPGTHVVRVEAEHYVPLSRTVEVIAGNLTSLEWTMTPAPKKRAVRHDREGIPDAPKSDFRP
jgi:serine/threonine protein kinase